MTASAYWREVDAMLRAAMTRTWRERRRIAQRARQPLVVRCPGRVTRGSTAAEGRESCVQAAEIPTGPGLPLSRGLTLQRLSSPPPCNDARDGKFKLPRAVESVVLTCSIHNWTAIYHRLQAGEWVAPGRRIAADQWVVCMRCEIRRDPRLVLRPRDRQDEDILQSIKPYGV